MTLRKPGRAVIFVSVVLLTSGVLIYLRSPHIYTTDRRPGQESSQTRRPGNTSTNTEICRLDQNDKVYSLSGNYTECVAKWLFTIDVRTKPSQYAAPGHITEAYQASGMMPRCYLPPSAANTTGGGSCFRVTDTRLGRLGLPSTYFRVVNESNVNDFVFVMGLSDSHYLESLDAIASVQKYMPGHVIIVYDLGLTDEQLNKLALLCGVKLEPFRGDSRMMYPAHVNNLATFAFKPLIIMEALKTYPAIVWLDSSARLYTSLSVFYKQIVISGGLFLFAPPPKHSVLHHTHPDVYRYFPSNTRKLRHTVILMPDGYYARSEGIYWGVLWWWALCALTEECIYPVKITPCSPFNAHNVLGYIGCHRYDMAVLNLLLSNYHGYDYSVYGGKRNNAVFEKLRKQTHKFDVNVCLE